jgi:hypothetical protein
MVIFLEIQEGRNIASRGADGPRACENKSCADDDGLPLA